MKKYFTLLFSAVLLIVALYSYICVMPNFSLLAFDSNSSEIDITKRPLRFADDTTLATVTVNIDLANTFPDYYLFQADDCITDLAVNGTRLPSHLFPICEYPLGAILPLAKYLHPGRNIVRSIVQNNGGRGGFNIAVASNDRLILLLRALILSTLCVFGFLLAKRAGVCTGVSLAFCLAMALRIIYFWATPYWIRGYDHYGHLAYVEFLFKNRWIPPAAEGWMYYQPPFYYLVGVCWFAIAKFFERATSQAHLDLQLISLLLSIASVSCVLASMRLLFDDCRKRTIASLLYVTLPGLIFFSARINNDVLLEFFLSASIYFFIRWCKQASWGDLKYSACLLSAAILTKTNALVFVFVYLITLFAKANRSNAVRAAVVMLLIVFVSTGWYFAYRYFSDDKVMLAGNVRQLDRELEVDSSLANLFIFNPLAVLKTPYNDSRDDRYRRDNFWEYFYRSAYFGEFKFGEKLMQLSAALLLLGMLGLGISVVGIFGSDVSGDSLSQLMLALLLGGLGVHLAYRYFVPFSSASDFRYSWFVALPICFFIAQAAEARSNVLNRMLSMAVFAHVSLVLVFILSLYFLTVPMWG